MNIIGLIGTAGAWANLKKAKAELEAAKAEAEANKDAILAAVAQYDNSKWDKLNEYDRDLYDPNKICEDILVIPILNIGMLVGYKCRIQPQLVLQNTSDEKTITIQQSSLYALFSVYGENTAVTAIPPSSKIILKPKERITVNIVIGVMDKSDGSWIDAIKNKLVTALAGGVIEINEGINKLKDRFISYFARTGYAKLITSVPKGSVLTGLDVITAKVSFDYCDNTDLNIRRAYYDNARGSAVYQGEAFYPGDKVLG